MANLLAIAEVAWSQLFPGGSDETLISREEFINTSKTEYAYQMWLKAMAEKRENGEYAVPSYLLSEKEFDVVNNEIDFSSVKVMRGLQDQEMWLQNVGGINCECRYIKSTVNHTQLLCDDDSLPEGARTYYVVGRKIKFPQGAHKKALPIIYANYGENVDGSIDVDDVIGGVVRRSLIEIYGGKIGRNDPTNNSNPET